MINNWASSLELMVLCVGIKMACLLARSIITRIAVNPLESGSCSMKTIEMESHGRSGTGKGLSKP